MEDGYWNLFWQTGALEFYLLQKRDGQQQGEDGTAAQTPPEALA